MTDIRSDFALETKRVVGGILSFSDNPSSTILEYGYQPMKNITLSEVGKSGTYTYARDPSLITYRIVGTEGDIGDATVPDVSYRNTGDESNQARFKKLEGGRREGGTFEYVAVSKDVRHSYDVNDSNQSVMDKFDSMARNIGIAIDVRMFESFSEKQTVYSYYEGGMTDKTGEEDGVTQYTVETDLSDATPETANKFLEEMAGKVVGPMKQTGVSSVDNFVFGVDDSIITMLNYQFKNPQKQYQNPYGDNFIDVPSEMFISGGLTMASFSREKLKEYEDGVYGYSWMRGAIQMAFDNYNRPEFTVSSNGLDGAQFGLAFKENLMAQLRTESMHRDTNAQMLYQQLLRRGYYPAGKMLPGNILHMRYLDLGAKNPNYNALLLEAKMAVPRLNSGLMTRLLFDNAKLPSYANAIAAAVAQQSHSPVDKFLHMTKTSPLLSTKEKAQLTKMIGKLNVKEVKAQKTAVIVPQKPAVIVPEETFIEDEQQEAEIA